LSVNFSAIFDCFGDSRLKPTVDVTPTIVKDWSLTPVHEGDNQLYRADPIDRQRSPVAVKIYHQPEAAQRESAVLHVLRDFGINLAPEPLECQGQILIMEWLPGQPFKNTPVPDDTTTWNQMMAAMGASSRLPFANYTNQVPMMGKGYQNPADVIDDMDRRLAIIDPNDPAYERLARLTERIREQVAPSWQIPPAVGLCRRNYALGDMLWDGHHLRVVDWKEADWGDIAAEIGMWSTHPDYEEVPASHWVWVRWEFARLMKDDNLVPRATTYSRLMQVWWAITLTGETPTPQRIAQRDRYLARAEKTFRP
jgi:hypothetical protein